MNKELLSETDIEDQIKELITNTYKARKAIKLEDKQPTFNNSNALFALEKISKTLRPRSIWPTNTEPNSGCCDFTKTGMIKSNSRDSFMVRSRMSKGCYASTPKNFSPVKTLR